MVREIRQLLRDNPFVPFVIKTADGHSHPVKHPDYAFVEPNNFNIRVFKNEDDFEIIKTLLITSVEVKTPRKKVARK